MQPKSTYDDRLLSMKQINGYNGLRVGVGRFSLAVRIAELVSVFECRSEIVLPTCGSHACFRFIQEVNSNMFRNAGALGDAEAAVLCIDHLQTRNASCSSRDVEPPRCDRTLTMRNSRYSP